MTPRLRILLTAIVAVALLGGAAAYGIVAYVNFSSREAGRSEVRTAVDSPNGSVPRILFRNTAMGAGYGLVASVPRADAGGARALTSVPCDRVYSTNIYEMCLRINRGVLTTFSATLFDSSWHAKKVWPLPGIPSRTRISPDSKLVAFTSFVTGSSYGTVGFSTATEISTTAGFDYGNLENFTLLLDGKKNTAADRNFWGVTFTSNDNVFYATAATAGHTWLVRGDLSTRTLTSIHETAECPSVSPDGKHVAYKKNISAITTPFWRIVVLDLATGTETVLPEKRSVDDQVEWLDNSTLLFGLARSSTPGDSDIWSIKADGTSAPKRLIQHAWSPAVVRP